MENQILKAKLKKTHKNITHKGSTHLGLKIIRMKKILKILLLVFMEDRPMNILIELM
jgi:hypothetical protein